MKAITLWQPWATLMAAGVKQIETRSWQTNYRGCIAVHAAKTFPQEARDLFWDEHFIYHLLAAGYQSPDDLPRGAVVSIHNLKDCYPTPDLAHPHKLFTSMSYYYSADGEIEMILPPPMPELVFGNYSPGRYAWHMPLVERLFPPQPARGKQGLWDWIRADYAEPSEVTRVIAHKE